MKDLVESLVSTVVDIKAKAISSSGQQEAINMIMSWGTKRKEKAKL